MRFWLVLIVVVSLSLIMVRCTMNQEEKALEKAKIQTVSSQNDIEIVLRAAEGNVAGVKELLESKAASVKSIDEFGVTPLISAVSNGRAETVQLLLDYIGKDAEVFDHAESNGKTALYYAVEFAQPELVSMLHRHGANPNLGNKNGDLPLHKATIMGNLQVIEALAANDAEAKKLEVNAADAKGNTALMLAANLGNKAMVDALLAYGANAELANAEGKTALMLAVENNNKDMVGHLLKKGVNVNTLTAAGKTALLAALQKNNSDMARHLLIKNADPSLFGADNLSPLEQAVNHDFADVVLAKAILAKLSKTPEERTEFANLAMPKAIHQGNREIVEMLFDAGADVNKLEADNSNGLILALENNDREIALLMLRRNSQINKFNAEGYSPLALAIKNGFIEISEELVAKGAVIEPTLKDESLSPLSILFENDDAQTMAVILPKTSKLDVNKLLLRAVAESRPKILQVLLKKGGNPNIADAAGKPAIWQAVAKNNLAAVQILADAGAELNVRDAQKGATPLMVAIAAKNEDIAKELLARNVELNILDSEGLSAVAYAILTYQPHLIKLLAQAGASLDPKNNGGQSLYYVVENSQLLPSQKDEATNLLKFLGAAN